MIVDQGRIIVQGSVGEISATGDPTVLIEVDDLASARRVLGAVQMQEEGKALRVTLDGDLTAAALNRSLVEAGIAVSRLEPARATCCEETFLLDHVAAGKRNRMRLIRAGGRSSSGAAA